MDAKTYSKWSRISQTINQSPNLAYLFAALSGLAFTVSNFMVQVTISLNKQSMPTLQLIFARSFVQLLIITPIIFVQRKPLGVPPKHIFALICMGVAGYIAGMLAFLSFDKIPISDALVISFTCPFFCVLFSICILKEGCHWFDIGCGIVSFIGVIIVARPSVIFGESNTMKVVLFQSRRLSKAGREWVYLLGVLCALLSGVTLALYFVLTRKFSSMENTFITIFYPSLFGSILAPSMLIMEKQSLYAMVIPDSLSSGIALVSIGATSSLALAFLTLSLKQQNAATVSLIRNLDVIYAFLLQYFFLGIKPNEWNIIGALIIVLSTSLLTLRKTVYRWCYESVRKAQNVHDGENTPKSALLGNQ